MAYQPVLILAHPEKVIRFLDPFRLGFMIRAFAVGQLALRIKAFASETIHSFIFIEINITGIVNGRQYFSTTAI